MEAINKTKRGKMKFYSVSSLLIRLKFMRKTIAGIITKEITKMLSIIVQFIPIINSNTI